MCEFLKNQMYTETVIGTNHKLGGYMKTILFQGDSITDADRSRVDNGKLGMGYPNVVAATLSSAEPGEYTFYNRGVSGNRIVDVYARIRSDIINLKPDYMSLLIGVNDVWHDQHQNGVDTAKFERIYTMLLEEIFEALPDIKIVLLEPFVLKGSATADCYDDFFRPEVEQRAAAVRRVAQRFSLPFIPLQEDFDKLQEKLPVGYLLGDGVHPTYVGHGLIAKKWMETFEEIK